MTHVALLVRSLGKTDDIVETVLKPLATHRQAEVKQEAAREAAREAA